MFYWQLSSRIHTFHASKVCYGLFLTSIKNKTLDRLDKMHVDIARNIQGMAPNTPAIVALACMKWWRLSTHIAKETLMLTWQILSLPMNSLYKHISLPIS